MEREAGRDLAANSRIKALGFLLKKPIAMRISKQVSKYLPANKARDAFRALNRQTLWSFDHVTHDDPELAVSTGL